MSKPRCRRDQKVGHEINGCIHEAADACRIGQQWASLWVLKSFGGPILLRNAEFGSMVIHRNTDRYLIVWFTGDVMAVSGLLVLQLAIASCTYCGIAASN